MQQIHKILIDGNFINSTTAFHNLMKEALVLPDYYGMNADALWDCLTEALLSDWQIDISWTSYAASQTSMGSDAELLKKTLLDAESEYPTNLRVTVAN